MKCNTILVQLGIIAACSAQRQAEPTTLYNPAPANPTVTPVSSALNYVYAGCWNETIYFDDGKRALSASTIDGSNANSVERCLAVCAQGENRNDSPIQYAGLEYGRECYCGQYINHNSKRLNESLCQYACPGNSSQLCGGSNALSVYNYTVSKQSAASIEVLVPSMTVLLSTLLGVFLL